MERIPRILSVAAVSDSALLVCFDGGVERIYDCTPLFSRPQFTLLKVPAFFRAVRVDPGGYGVSWNDDMDLSEHELWTNGTPADRRPCSDGSAAPAYPRVAEPIPTVADASRRRPRGK